MVKHKQVQVVEREKLKYFVQLHQVRFYFWVEEQVARCLSLQIKHLFEDLQNNRACVHKGGKLIERVIWPEQFRKDEVWTFEDCFFAHEFTHVEQLLHEFPASCDSWITQTLASGDPLLLNEGYHVELRGLRYSWCWLLRWAMNLCHHHLGLQGVDLNLQRLHIGFMHRVVDFLLDQNAQHCDLII